MAANGSAFRVARPGVIHDTIDGEVVIINLSTGAYFSLVDTGAEVWSGLGGEASVDAIVSEIATRYRTPPEEIRAAVEGLLDDLRAEGLVVPVEGAAPPADGERRPGPDPGADGRPEFRPPVLEKFDDMQDLILLDPVHEVEEELGWPHARRSDGG